MVALGAWPRTHTYIPNQVPVEGLAPRDERKQGSLAQGEAGCWTKGPLIEKGGYRAPGETRAVCLGVRLVCGEGER